MVKPAKNVYGRALAYILDPHVFCSWGFADDVSLQGYDQEGRLIVLGLTAKEARALGDDLFRAAQQADELEEGYNESCAKDAESPKEDDTNNLS